MRERTPASNLTCTSSNAAAIAMALVFLCTCPGLAQSGRTATDAEIGNVILAEMVNQNLIGVAVAVIENGRTTYSQGFGYSDLGHETKMTDETVLRWASISKTLTAVTVLQLVEDGVLKLGDSIAERINDPGSSALWPRSGNAGGVTIDNLLQHRSGLHQYGKDRNGKKVHQYDAGKYRSDGTEFNGRSAPLTFDHKVDFVPRTNYRYTTFGFVLLGSLVDRVSPEGDYVKHVQRRVATPLGMRLTVSRNNKTGYARSCDGVLALDRGEKNTEWKLPGGGWQSNIKDLAHFAEGLMNGKLLKNTSALWTPPVSNRYSRGIYRSGSGQNLRVWHDGIHGNAKTLMHFFPNRKIGVVLLSNTGYADLHRIARRIYTEAFGLTLYNQSTEIVHSCAETKSCAGRFTGIWRKTGRPVVHRRGYDTHDFGVERQFLNSRGYKLQDVETYWARNSQRWDGVFIKDNTAARFVSGLSHGTFGSTWKKYGQDGFELVDVETYMVNPNRLWAGVFHRRSGKDALYRDMTSDEFGRKQEELGNQGFKLIDIEVYRIGRKWRWAGVWTEGPASLVNRGYTTKEFMALRDRRMKNGWKLVDVETYRVNSVQRWAGVWERSNLSMAMHSNRKYCGSKNAIIPEMKSLESGGYELIDWTVH